MFFFKRRHTGLDAIIHRRKESWYERFCRQPCLLLAQMLYSWRRLAFDHEQTKQNPVSVVCISDTHNRQVENIPSGDILIHAGDLTQSGSLVELQKALEWLSSLPHAIKIVVAGNHDILLDAKKDSESANLMGRDGETPVVSQRESLSWRGLIYLQNSTALIQCPNGRRLRIHGSPLSPKHGNGAFQYPRTENPWASSIPEDVDILVTHGPPRAHLDLGFGCIHLLREIWRVRPLLHVFGHIHAGAGIEHVRYDNSQDKYEQIIIAGGGIWNLVKLLLILIWELLVWRKPVGDETVLVNAAMVGGLRDTELREAIKVLV